MTSIGGYGDDAVSILSGLISIIPVFIVVERRG